MLWTLLIAPSKSSMGRYVRFLGRAASWSGPGAAKERSSQEMTGQQTVCPVCLLADFQESSGHQASLLRSRTKSLSPSFLRDSPAPDLEVFVHTGEAAGLVGPRHAMPVSTA